MSNKNHRRAFIQSGLAAVSTIAAQPLFGAAADNTSSGRNPIGVSTYSFWQFRRSQYRPIEKCLELAAQMGFAGAVAWLADFDTFDCLIGQRHFGIAL